MTEYIIISTISLIVLYIIYYFLLRNTKSFVFNRFYLLFVVIFSLIIPFIKISIPSGFLNYQIIQDFSLTIYGNSIKGEIVNGQSDSGFVISNLFVISYIIISSIFLFRFVFNLWKIKKLIDNSNMELNGFPKIVLTNNKTLPYSFFQYIVLNKTEYEKGQIDYDLILHEQVHCNQYHSFDIVFVEIMKIILWFNPIVWILKKEIQLNHEYLADSKVLRTQNLKTYQDILLNLVFRNNSTYLASNFNYSLTKKRLIMINLKKSKSDIYRAFIAICMVVFIGLAFACSKASFEQMNEQVEHSNLVPPPPPSPSENEYVEQSDIPPPPPPPSENEYVE